MGPGGPIGPTDNVALTVTSPRPVTGAIVTLVPATIEVTPLPTKAEELTFSLK